MPLTVSVIVPAHNAEGTIAKAVDSAFRQTVPPLEVIVVCDGCTDATAEISQRLGAKVILAAKSNGSVARNIGAQAAVGDVLFFLDADDWWEPVKIERHLEAWARTEASFVIDRSTPILPDGSRARWTGGIAEERHADWSEFLGYRAWASGSSFSVLSETFRMVGGFNERLTKFQDVDFWVRAAHAAGPAYSLGRSYTNYRLSDAPTVSKGASNIESNLRCLFEGWPFATEAQRSAFASHAYLTAAEVTKWPASVALFSMAHWPIGRRYFWKCLVRSVLHKGGVS